MNTKAEILAWAKGILAKGTTAAPHELLQIAPSANASAAADAFMNLARVAHPDLHRNALTATEFDQLVLAYSRVAGAYQAIRTARPRGGTLIPPISGRPAPATTPPPAAGASTAMNSKAIIYFRKAELALKRGDLRNAILQIKMAIAADPQSAMLRTALGQVEAELAKSKA